MSDMTLSMRHAVDMLLLRGKQIDAADLGYILTVMRDNVWDDDVHRLLGDMLQLLTDRAAV